MEADLWSLYRHMFRSRLFEEAVKRLWEEGRISGEMHLGTGEEAVAAGVVTQLSEGDALALDHRGTPPLLMRGVAPVCLLREFLGRSDGLCAGMGGHMHLYSPQHLAMSSGIVGASGPAGVGLALAAQHLRPGTLAAAFFGEGAMNQGMLLEAMNLAVVWKLPLLLVCKDNDWAISTVSASVTAGALPRRAEALGMPAVEMDGCDVQAVWQAARDAIARARQGEGPTFLYAHCARLDGHFLGDALLRTARHPTREAGRLVSLARALTHWKGTSIRQRAESAGVVGGLVAALRGELDRPGRDPVARTRFLLTEDAARLSALEDELHAEVDDIVAQALAPAESSSAEEVR